MNVGIKIYKTEKLIFIIDGELVVVKTPLGQTFYLRPVAHYWRRRLNVICAMIELNEIRDLNELSEWCVSGKGVAWVSTDRKYQLANEDVLG